MLNHLLFSRYPLRPVLLEIMGKQSRDCSHANVNVYGRSMRSRSNDAISASIANHLGKALVGSPLYRLAFTTHLMDTSSHITTKHAAHHVASTCPFRICLEKGKSRIEGVTRDCPSPVCVVDVVCRIDALPPSSRTWEVAVRRTSECILSGDSCAAQPAQAALNQPRLESPCSDA